MTLTLGISSCLLGEKVRFDGGHKRDAFICQFLNPHVELVPICPEMGAGLPTPRPAMRLIGDPNAPKLIEIKHPEIEHSKALKGYSNSMMKHIKDLSGYILKSKSPSCGLKSVKVYQENGAPKPGKGLFAEILEAKYPNLPIEEEGRLNDPKLRENFIERIFVYQRLRELITQHLTKKNLMEFHTRHKLTLRAHDEKSYQQLGKLMADLSGKPIKGFAKDYEALFMAGMKRIASAKKHANVLMHCLGYFKKALSSEDKQELLDAINEYRLERLPLIVPITLIRHHLRHHPNEYLEQQYYLNPYPKELMLRNHI